MQYSELIKQQEINYSLLTKEQREWYDNYLQIIRALKLKQEKLRRQRKAKHPKRSGYEQQYTDLQLLEESISYFEQHYDLESETIQKPEASLLKNYNRSGDYVEFRSERRVGYYKRDKIIGLINDTITNLKLSHSSLRDIDIFNALLNHFSKRCFTDEELTFFSNLYFFAHSKKNFIVRHKNNSHKPPITITMSYIELHDYLIQHKDLSCKQRYYVGDLMKSILNLNRIKANILINYIYHQNSFTEFDYKTLKTLIPNFDKNVFHSTLQKIIALQKKDFA